MAKGGGMKGTKYMSMGGAARAEMKANPGIGKMPGSVMSALMGQGTRMAGSTPMLKGTKGMAKGGAMKGTKGMARGGAMKGTKGMAIGGALKRGSKGALKRKARSTKRQGGTKGMASLAKGAKSLLKGTRTNVGQELKGLAKSAKRRTKLTGKNIRMQARGGGMKGTKYKAKGGGLYGK
jgi:hypothetical protein